MIDILERDNFICGICHEEAPRSLKGTVDPRAPEIDHIIPRSRKGKNNPDNLRCAHRMCNLKKLSFLDSELESVGIFPPGPVLDAVAVYEATKRQRDGGHKGGTRVHQLYPNAARENIIKTHQRYPNLARESGAKAGKKTLELHPDHFSKIGKLSHALNPNTCGDAGRQAHKDHPTLAHENGLLTHKLHPDHALRTIRRAHELNPNLAREASKKGLHIRWHVTRGIIDPNCSLCKEINYHG